MNTTLTAARRALLELLAMPRIITDAPIMDRLTVIQNYLDARVPLESDTHSLGPERRPFDEERLSVDLYAVRPPVQVIFDEQLLKNESIFKPEYVRVTQQILQDPNNRAMRAPPEISDRLKAEITAVKQWQLDRANGDTNA